MTTISDLEFQISDDGRDEAEPAFPFAIMSPTGAEIG
jgi:hypothetical protein